MGFCIHKVSPPASDLPDEQAKGAHICQGEERDLFVPRHQKGDDDAGDDATVDGQPTPVNVQTGHDV